MRRLALILALLSITLWGITAQALKMRIIENLAQLVTGQAVPSVYVDFNVSSDLQDTQIRLLKMCEDAEVVFVKEPETFFQMCPTADKALVFVLSYRDYLRYQNRLIGAFFWQKGRPNIILNERALKSRHITLPERYKKYVE